jgi:predicted nucleic acid-binding protein
VAKDLYYWDSNVFSGFLNEEPDKAADCETVLKEAQAGHILLVTSALTLAEVLFIKNGPKLDPSQRDKIDRFFKADYITVRNVTRIIADLGRDVFWNHNIRPKDCVHVSTAAFYKVPIMHTFEIT